jgi:PAS domain-containing protein
MLAEEIDFYRVFRLHPTMMALLTPDLEIIDVNDEYLAATGRPLEELLGKHMFAVLPKMPPDPGGNPKWTALEEAQASGRRASISLTRYDVEDPATPGVFQERYWSAAVTPVRGSDGHVEVLEFSAREVTPIIDEYKKLEAHENERPAASPPAAVNNKPVPGLSVPSQRRAAAPRRKSSRR